MNTRVVRWFESGNATNALLGRGPYFVAETTYRDQHDRLLVLDQLLRWADPRDRLDTAGHAFMEALRTTVADSDITAAYDLVWSYLLVRKDHEVGLPLNRDDVIDLLDAVDQQTKAAGKRDTATQLRVREALAKSG